MMNGPSHYDKSIGIWISDKKSQKLNWNELTKACSSHGYNLIKLDLERPLEDQGHIDIFLHKLTDILSSADRGDPKASLILSRVEQYLSNHPNITVIDPLDNVRILLNRYRYYSILHNEPSFKKQGIFTPNFAEFTTNNEEMNLDIMKQRGVKFPVICKKSFAHDMIVIFNEKGLSVCRPPCVVQSFVNHNAVLHKVFLVGNRYYICERPSLKNFYASENLAPIFYSTADPSNFVPPYRQHATYRANCKSKLFSNPPEDTQKKTLKSSSRLGVQLHTHAQKKSLNKDY